MREKTTVGIVLPPRLPAKPTPAPDLPQLHAPSHPVIEFGEAELLDLAHRSLDDARVLANLAASPDHLRGVLELLVSYEPTAIRAQLTVRDCRIGVLEKHLHELNRETDALRSRADDQRREATEVRRLLCEALPRLAILTRGDAIPPARLDFETCQMPHVVREPHDHPGTASGPR